jgi:hypothetical protein
VCNVTEDTSEELKTPVRRGRDPRSWGLDETKTLAVMRKNAGSNAYHAVMREAEKGWLKNESSRNAENIKAAKERAIVASDAAKASIVIQDAAVG